MLAGMWYPTVQDVLDVYERVASYEGHPADVRNRNALDRAIVAPQHEGGDQATPETLAKKAAALMISVVENRLFEPCTQRTAFALTHVFLDRNGVTFQASIDGMGELFYQISDGTLGHEDLATWIEARLEPQNRQRNAQRILSALTHIARVIEDLEGMPGLHRHADSLDNAGNAICLEVAALLEVGKNVQDYVQESYPAVDERWGEAFEI